MVGSCTLSRKGSRKEESDQDDEDEDYLCRHLCHLPTTSLCVRPALTPPGHVWETGFRDTSQGRPQGNQETGHRLAARAELPPTRAWHSDRGCSALVTLNDGTARPTLHYSQLVLAMRRGVTLQCFSCKGRVLEA